MSATLTYDVIFPEWYDDRGEWEAEAKGWLQGVQVRFANGMLQSLFFYDPIRLAQDIEMEASTTGETPFIACPGLVVVPKITRQSILNAVEKLVAESYLPICKSEVTWSINDVIHTVPVVSVA